MFKGRTINYDGTGGLILSPIQALLHIKKQQSFIEDDTFTDGYSDNALIKTSGDGSYNDVSLDDLSEIEVCRQLLTTDDASTDELTQSLCREFFLVSYQDNNGYECVKYLFDTTTPSDSIGFANIIGDVGEIEEPRHDRVYCEPVINYAYDYATSKYTKQLKITGTMDGTFSQNLCTGFATPEDSSSAWQKYRGVYLKVSASEPMPQSVSNLKWIRRYEDALWYLNVLADYMTYNRLTISIPYEMGRLWYPGRRVSLSLPHPTMGQTINCAIEAITKAKNKGTCTLKLIIMGEVIHNELTNLQDQTDLQNDANYQDQTYYINSMQDQTNLQ
jgi:hypothetical protein